MENEIRDLQKVVAILKRRTMYFGSAAFTTTLVLILGFSSQKPPENEFLRVRQITVVDEKGVERMYIGSPVPDPMVRGKRVPRRLASTGIIMNNEKGSEVGGWGVLADGTQQLIFDDSTGQERVALFQPPSGKRGGMVMKDERGAFRLFIGMVNSDDPRSVLRDNKGRLRLEAVVDSTGQAVLSFYDENGNELRSVR